MGTGGGIFLVPTFKLGGFDTKNSHIYSTAVIIFLSAFSAFIYARAGYIDFPLSLSYIPAGVAGGALGAVIFKKISPLTVKTIFGAVLFLGGLRRIILILSGG